MIITGHIDRMVTDFRQRFIDLDELLFPKWLTHYQTIELNDVSATVRDELTDLQNDASAAVSLQVKRQFMWLDEDICEKYPTLTARARSLLLPFPTSYLVKCAFSCVTDLLTKKRGCLDITQRGDLRLKLTKLTPDIATMICHQEITRPRERIDSWGQVFTNRCFELKLSMIMMPNKT